MVFDKKTLVIPNETVNENSHMQVLGDIILDDRVVVDYTLATEKRIFAGEWVKVNGDMTAEDDIRIDSYSEIHGDIIGGNDIYLGERVKVAGKLTVGKDLEVGSDVTIEDGFDAKGWINIRNPIPMIIYFFIYLFNLSNCTGFMTGNDVLCLLDELDEMVLRFGGRVYLAKDARLAPKRLRAMYPRLDEWLRIKHAVDPLGRFSSDLSFRLGLDSAA